MQWIIDLRKKPSNKARRNLAGFQLCYRLKAQSRCVENFVTVLQTAQQNWALLYSDWSWFLVSHGNMRKIQLPCGLWVKTWNWNRGTPNPQHTNQTKAKDLHKGCVPQCWIWQITNSFPFKAQFLIIKIWLLIFLSGNCTDVLHLRYS